MLVQLKVISGGKEYYGTSQRDRQEPYHEALESTGRILALILRKKSMEGLEKISHVFKRITLAVRRINRRTESREIK